MGRSPEQMRRSSEQVRRSLEQESRDADPTEYAPRSSFDPGRLRLPSIPSPAGPPSDHRDWRTTPDDEVGVDFVRFDPRVLGPPRSGFRVFSILGQVTFGLLIVAACGY